MLRAADIYLRTSLRRLVRLALLFLTAFATAQAIAQKRELEEGDRLQGEKQIEGNIANDRTSASLKFPLKGEPDSVREFLVQVSYLQSDGTVHYLHPKLLEVDFDDGS